MAVTKEEHIQQELLPLTQDLLSLLLFPFGVGTIMLLSILDYFVTPENFTKFLIYRIIFASLMMVEYLILKLKKNNSILQSIITLSGALTTATMVELMIFSFGGHQSSYYAGMIIVLVFVLGFIPLSLRMTALVSSLVCAIYFVPIMLFDHITNSRVFINNNIFLISFALGGFAWRYYNNNLLLKKLSLEYDLSIANVELKKHSDHLEQLVDEKTKNLAIVTKKYMTLFENSNDGIALISKEGIILEVNNKFSELHGFDRDALKGVHFRILEPEENEEVAKKRLERIIKGDSLIFETEHYRKDGTKIALEVSSKGIEIEGEFYIQSLYRDITEKKALQRQLIQAQKMESVGMLAGGLAHDFRNLLTVIHGYSEMIDHIEDDPTIKKYANGIDGATRKAEQMVTSLLQFAKQSTGEITTMNINDIVENVTNLVSPMLIKENITIEKRLSESLPSLKGDPHLIEQVIMNLVINAKDAMPDGGKIKVETSITDVNEDNSIHPLLCPGEHVTLRISDSGTGIPEEIKDRIFEPFFTTKGAKGTGLGLAMAYGIVKAHKGIIKVNSEIGKGSTFEIYLPLYADLKPIVTTEEVKISIVALIRDAELIERLRSILEAKGYRVIHAESTSYCLDILSGLSNAVNIFMVELSMVDANFLSKLKSARPDIKIILISDREVPVRLIEDENVKIALRIPFNDSLLISAVQSVTSLNRLDKLPQDLSQS